MPIDPSKNMNAGEDFMLLIIHVHVIASARVIERVSKYFSGGLSQFNCYKVCSVGKGWK